MPLKKLMFKPGIDRETTRYTSEGGYYDCDKVRFRSGSPEKIGGWEQVSNVNTFQGTARSLWPWSTFAYAAYLGVGTNLKYYIMYGGAYNDITPIRSTVTLTNPFTATNGSAIITVADVAHGCEDGDFVTFSGATGLGGNITATVLNAEYQVTVIDDDSYTITATATANATDAAGSPGGGTVTAAYQLNVGNAIQVPLSGWGGGPWGLGPWGTGSTTIETIRIWNNQNFGEDLLFGPKGGGLYYWDVTSGLGVRGVAVTSLTGASEVPLYQNLLVVSDTSRFCLCLGTNDFGSVEIDPMLIRWSDQESVVNWTPTATNQAGSLRLSHGSEILGFAQVRQEILVWTDTSLYSLQYLGPPVVWGSQLLADNVTILNDRAMATGAGVTYWMGEEKFYVYDGRVQTLPCSLRQYVFSDFNPDQADQVFASTVERFSEIWWFYPSAGSTVCDKYVIYNYLEKIWYYGTMDRSSWIDASVVSNFPISAYNNQLLYQEAGVDDGSNGVSLPIEAYITTSEFDIEDGHNFGFVWRVLPDITFRGSTAASPQALLTLLPLQNSGSGYNNPQSVAGSSSGMITRSATVPVEQFTGQVNIRVRGRQMAMKVESTELGVQWQLGAPRLDIKPDGRR
tara:strand:+ start:11884 stop:13755 length:1872 start_codon:yes stop_codon:yes gene_type:complete